MRYSIPATILLALSVCAIAADIALCQIDDPCNAGRSVPIGQFVSNAYPRGEVDYVYRIGVREITQQEYCDFLNDCAAEWLAYAYNPASGITKNSDGVFIPAEGQADAPVHSVSRAAAALWCNWASGAEVYAFQKKEKDGRETLMIPGERDLFTPASPRLYYIPDLDEFYKAGFYDGNGTWRNITEENRHAASRYGMQNVASGVSEWMDSRYVESTYALGASDSSDSADDLNAITLHNSAISDTHTDAATGFRVAATAPVALAPRLNDHDNFFGPEEKNAILRLRCDRPEQQISLRYTVTDFFGKVVTSESRDLRLVKGVTDVELPLPPHDGYYLCKAELPDGTCMKMPFQVMREARHAPTGEGRFGLNAPIIRSERGWNRKPFDFPLFLQTGADWVRTDTFENPETIRDVLSRAKAAGLSTIVIPIGPFRPNDWSVKSREIADKWSARGVMPELADNFEKVMKVVPVIAPFCDVLELGNEPQWWWTTPEDYAGYVRQLAPLLRQAAPGVRLMISDMSSCARPFLELGAGEDVDLLNVHTYTNYNTTFWGIVGWMRRLNAVAKANGVGGKPYWMTETGICTYSAMYLVPLANLDDVMQYQAMMIPKDMISQVAYGCEKVIPYTFQDPVVHSREESFGIIDRHGLPKPAFSTYRLTAETLALADFEGFLKGHQVAVGKLSAFGFRQKNGRRTAVFWRNDAYMHNQYTIPYAQMVKPREMVALPGSGTATLLTLDGVRETLTAENGLFQVPVDEYPCFVTGDALDFQFQDEQTALALPETVHPDAFVQILPVSFDKKALHYMGGYELTAVPAIENTIRVRVHNLTHETMEGDCRLLSPESWCTFGWTIAPAAAHVTIAPRGMTTATFTAVPNADFAGEKEGLDLKCQFIWGDRRMATDKVRVRPGKELKVSDWQTPANGWTLSEHAAGLQLTWKGEHRPSAMVYYRNRPHFAEKPVELEKTVTVEFDADVRLTSACLMCIDAGGETFMLHRRLPEPAQAGVMRFDCRDFLKDGKAIAYGGDKDNVITFPMTLQGVIFDVFKPDNARKSGTVLLKTLRTALSPAAESFEKKSPSFREAGSAGPAVPDPSL